MTLAQDVTLNHLRGMSPRDFAVRHLYCTTDLGVLKALQDRRRQGAPIEIELDGNQVPTGRMRMSRDGAWKQIHGTCHHPEDVYCGLTPPQFILDIMAASKKAKVVVEEPKVTEEPTEKPTEVVIDVPDMETIIAAKAPSDEITLAVKGTPCPVCDDHPARCPMCEEDENIVILQPGSTELACAECGYQAEHGEFEPGEYQEEDDDDLSSDEEIVVNEPTSAVEATVGAGGAESVEKPTEYTVDDLERMLNEVLSS